MRDVEVSWLSLKSDQDTDLIKLLLVSIKWLLIKL